MRGAFSSTYEDSCEEEDERAEEEVGVPAAGQVGEAMVGLIGKDRHSENVDKESGPFLRSWDSSARYLRKEWGEQDLELGRWKAYVVFSP